MSEHSKHIAVVCNYRLNPNRIGGMDRFFVTYDKACKSLGYKVDWFFPQSTPYDFYNGLYVYSGEEDVETIFLKHCKHRKEKYTIVVTHFVELCTSFFKKIKQKDNPYVIAVDHNPRPLQGFSAKKQIKNSIKGLLYGIYIDCFIGVSKYTCKHLRKDYGVVIAKKIKLVYNGIDTSVYAQRESENKNKFIVASHLRYSKGIQDLIEVVALLQPALQQKITIDVFGEGPFIKELKLLTMKKGLEKNIIFKGSTSQLPQLYKNYSYMLQPTYMECFSLSILESLAANVPVVTTTVGGNLEVIYDGENGYIFSPGDIAALQKIIEQILENKIGIQGDVSAKIKSNFTINQMVENHIKLLPCTSAS